LLLPSRSWRAFACFRLAQIPRAGRLPCRRRKLIQRKKDDATCREKGLTPGTETYDACRNTLVQARADEAAAQERRRIEFQRTIGAGTSDYTGH